MSNEVQWDHEVGTPVTVVDVPEAWGLPDTMSFTIVDRVVEDGDHIYMLKAENDSEETYPAYPSNITKIEFEDDNNRPTI